MWLRKADIMWHTSNPKRGKRRTRPPRHYGRTTRCSEKRERNKAPGPEGICHEFYKNKMWDIIKNELLDSINIMHLADLVSEEQKHGHIECLPKIGFPAHPKNYRPLTILNTGYTIPKRPLTILNTDYKITKRPLTILITDYKILKWPLMILNTDYKILKWPLTILNTDYKIPKRPLTILNKDYKIPKRITANRLRTRMEEVLHHNQYCGRNDKSKYDVVATVRDIIVYAEDTKTNIPTIDRYQRCFR